MSSSPPPSLVLVEEDDSSLVATPVLTQRPTSPGLRSSTSSLPDVSPVSPAEPLLSPHSGHLRLPIPTPSANKSQSSFAFVDVSEDDPSGDFDDLPPEVASADISIARSAELAMVTLVLDPTPPDGSFVETPSGSAAIELKKRYDRLLGVGKSVRSPYAITAFVNQHGKQMFRVGHRDQSAPAAAGAEAERRTTIQIVEQPTVSQQDNKKSTASTRSDRRSARRSRMSMHTFLPPSMFPSSSTRHPEPTSAHLTHDGHKSPARKLRKARSNPQLSAESSTPPTQPSGPTGRGHSQSVTAADMPRIATAVVSEPIPRGDIFSTVLQWKVPPSPVASSLTSPSPPGSELALPDTPRSPVIVAPFGARVTFDSPSRPTDTLLTSPPLLREMQSFESGLTARADNHLRLPRSSVIASMMLSSPPEGVIEPIDPLEVPLQTDPSTPSLSPAPFLTRQDPEDRSYLPSTETSLHTRYSTEVFDVLQTYRGLPLLDKLSPDSTETTVIKMSLNSEDTAAPRDDPRFVIWGEVYPEPTEVRIESSTDQLSSRSGASRRRSSQLPTEDSPQVHVTTVIGDPEKVLVAATIERWIAQLTSEFNYDELLVFFLTYRTYISATDLCHLLIARFHWALGRSTSEYDERVRRIVRVRTFVAIRYWLLTFFGVDFVPNRELRMLLASWLNSLRRDPILQKHTDAPNIVRKLVSVVRECKEMHSQRGRPLMTAAGSVPATLAKTGGKTLDDLPRKSVALANESDLDLDFIMESTSSSLISSGGFYGAATTGVVSGVDGTKAVSLLQQPLHRAIMDHRPSISTTPAMPIAQTPATLPVHHNALSRAFVNTIGRLGRWKRVLNARSTTVSTPLGACADVSAFDLELNATGDLLTVRGGVEQYLKLIEQPAVPPVESASAPVGLRPGTATQSSPTASVMQGPEAAVNERTNGSADGSEAESVGDAHPSSEDAGEVQHVQVASPAPVHGEPLRSPVPVQIHLHSSGRSRTSSDSSGSSSSYGALISSPHFQARPPQERSWQMDIVSIDDLDLSDTSSNGSAGGPAQPPGLKRLPRRLPLRRDFEFVQRPTDSVSSMGLTSHESLSGPSSSAASSASVGGLGSTIQQWQVNALVDSLSDEEGEGDVEGALRRLEGQMNPAKQREKESKVDNWVKTIRERIEAGDYGDEQPRYTSDGEEAPSEVDTDQRDSVAWSQDDSRRNSGSQVSVRLIVSTNALVPDSTTPVAAQTPYPPSLNAGASVNTNESKPAVEDVVPAEILQSRVSAVASATSHSPTSPQQPAPAPAQSPPVSKFVHPRYPRIHRSWVQNHSAMELAQHFSMIDRELFLGVRFEELVSDEWLSTIDEANILDWSSFLKDRARWKAEGRSGYKTSAVIAARGRFNLIANFVLSEIVLTYPTERPVLVGKFIRIAWKCFNLNNFSTLVAIIAGLRNEWVTRAMRKSWNRVNVYNLRMLKDLTAFTQSDHDFAHIRNAMAMLSDAPPGAQSEEAASVRSSTKGKASADGRQAPPAACIPFLGIYFSQLRRFSDLPDLIDPTAPHETVGVDPISGNFNAPAHPEVFATLTPLPPSMQLEPLINVHKQRLIAGTIKELVAGQHLASRVQFPIDRKLFQRCLKLRGLDEETLHRAFAMYPS
ncbi:ras GEF [Auriscalpium vulgare]|uniref:Ras GEF n=1 Tax=Auriscalpium vulgare TaxID=40419 RepID=A0ACB8S7A5_9AGAM|nr:ras GEF [Auriscalpium vulgare]